MVKLAEDLAAGAARWWTCQVCAALPKKDRGGARGTFKFQTHAGMQDHQKAKHAVACPECGKTCATIDGLKHHRNAAHPKDPANG